MLYLTQILSEELIHKKSPQEITALLYEACIINLEKSIRAIHSKNYIDANEHLQKSNDILYRLGGGINYEAGIVADQLEALYDYMANKLIAANLRKDTQLIKEVLHIMKQIATAWNEALQKKTDAQSGTLKQKALAYEHSGLYDNEK